MEIVKMTPENIGVYKRLAECDILENDVVNCPGLLALRDDVAKGAILWKYHYSNGEAASDEILFFEAEDEGIAEALLKAHDSQIMDDGFSHSFFELGEVSDNVRMVLKRAGFWLSESESRDIVYKLSEKEARPIIQPEKPLGLRKLKDISDREFWNGTTFCLYNHLNGLLEELEIIPRDFFDGDTSTCIMKDGYVIGMFLIRRMSSGTLIPVLLFYVGEDSKKNLLCMMNYSLNLAKEKYPADTNVIIGRHNDSTMKLAGYFFPEKKGGEVTLGERIR